MQDSWVYILRCADGSYYAGSTTDLRKRIAEHDEGKFEGYTSSRRPLKLVFSQRFEHLNDAIQAERQIKHWSRQKKEALIAGDFELLHELASCRNETHHSMVGSPVSDANLLHPSTPLRVTIGGDAGVGWLNSLDDRNAKSELERCCGSSAWVQGMLLRRPFRNREELFFVSDDVWRKLTADDWKEAFSHHPKIGDVENLRIKFAGTSQWAEGEQSGVKHADEDVLTKLAEGNRLYEEKFGYIFIVCATGKSAVEMLQLLQQRLPKDPETEIHIAAAEQAKITRLRLEKLLGDHQ